MSSRPKPWYRSKWFNLTVGTCFTALSLWWAFRTMRQGGDGPDGLKPVGEVLQNIKQAFADADYRTLPPIWLALAAFYIIKAWRWKLLLEPMGRFRTMTDLLPSVMIGFAFNNVLPAHLGEFVRTFVFSRQHKQPATGVFSSIALERVCDVIAILSFLALGLVVVDSSQIDPKVVIGAWIFAAAAGVAIAGAALYLVWTDWFVNLIESTLLKLPFVPDGVEQKVAGMLEAGAAGLASLRSPRLLAGILLTSYLQWAINGGVIWLSLWAFDITVPFSVAAIVLGVLAIGVTVPSTPGYFGVIQLCFVLVLKLFVDESKMEAVGAASIYYHMAQWVPITGIGMLYFLRAGFRLSEIEDEAEHAEDNTEVDTAMQVRQS